MQKPGALRQSGLMERLRSDTPMVAAELRPPRSGLSYAESMSTWIDLHHAIRRLTRDDTLVFLTDNAVGEQEEENLLHLTTNLAGDVDLDRVVPFLTCKHPLAYCLGYAERTASVGSPGMVVLGGDRRVGPPRCVDHAYQLRRKIRAQVPDLHLGGWANPHADPRQQAGYLASDDFTAEFFLTQIVSHHDLDAVDAFLEELERQEVTHPGVFGVFYYRSANPETLDRLSRFFPVPVQEITREFDRGLSPARICARSVRELWDRGVHNVYVSNLDFREAAEQRREILEELRDGTA